jgi:DNA helicase-2/ATP-dependent DNA helicase PcrA
MVLSTIHRAKGLEWKNVFIPMLSEGVFPNPKSYDEIKAYEEERRIFYVAMTRAKDRLYLLYPSRVRVYGDYQYVDPSPFLSELNSKLYKKSTVNYTRSFISSYDLYKKNGKE